MPKRRAFGVISTSGNDKATAMPRRQPSKITLFRCVGRKRKCASRGSRRAESRCMCVNAHPSNLDRFGPQFASSLVFRLVGIGFAENNAAEFVRHLIRKRDQSQSKKSLPNCRDLFIKTRKILFPTDFSSKGDAALEYAADLARERHALLVIVHVQEPPVMYGDGAYYYGQPEPDAELLRNMLQAVKPHDPTVACQYRFALGLPAAAIVSVAKEEDVDLIVMSSHGRTGLSRVLMGSVAEEVMRKAECPVMVVKPTAKAEAVVAAGSKP